MRAWVGILAAVLLTACGSDDSGGGAPAAGGNGGTGGTSATGGAGGQAGTGGDAGTGGTCTADVQTDPDNCGTCGHTCQGGDCEAGVCQAVTLASALAYPYRLAPDAQNLFVTTAGTFSAAGPPNFDGTVASLALSGGSLTDLGQGSFAAYGVAVDASNVYFSYWADSTVGVMGGAKDGTDSVSYGSHMTMFIVPDVAGPSTTATAVYFLDNVSVYAASVSGGDTSEVASGSTPLSGLALAGSDLVFGEAGDQDSSGNLTGNGQLSKAPAAGGATVALDANAGSPYAVAVDATHAYYTDMAGGRVVAAALDGSGAAEIATGQSYPYGIVVDDDYVYWTNRGGPYWEHDTSCGGAGSLMRAPKAGGAAQTLASGLACAGWLAQDQKALYWVEQGSLPYESSEDGSIAKLAK